MGLSSGSRLGASARILVALALLTLSVPAPAIAAGRDTPLAVGDRAPAIELGDQHGARFRLAEALAGNRWVVLAFYPQAFTGG